MRPLTQDWKCWVASVQSNEGCLAYSCSLQLYVRKSSVIECTASGDHSTKYIGVVLWLVYNGYEAIQGSESIQVTEHARRNVILVRQADISKRFRRVCLLK